MSHAPLRAVEQIVGQSGLQWTHLRPGGFTTNAFAWVPSVRAHRTIAAPFADAALPAVDPQDIAAVAAVVLTRPGHGGMAYTLTRPEATSPRRPARWRSWASRLPMSSGSVRTCRPCWAARRPATATGHGAASVRSAGRLRFVQLRGRITTVTPKVLTQRLRQLELDGLVRHHCHAEVPPRVEYEITELGLSLAQLAEWAGEHLSDVEQARLDYDAAR